MDAETVVTFYFGRGGMGRKPGERLPQASGEFPCSGFPA